MNSKLFKIEMKKSKREKSRCKKLYPDWKDDEYNCGPLKYVWGVKTNKDSATNFNELTYMDIYYNRDTRKYLLSLDTTYEEMTTEQTIQHLNMLCSKFQEYSRENFDVSINPFKLSYYASGDIFQDSSLTELYYKFKIFVKGFENL